MSIYDINGKKPEYAIDDNYEWYEGWHRDPCWEERLDKTCLEWVDTLPMLEDGLYADPFGIADFFNFKKLGVLEEDRVMRTYSIDGKPLETNWIDTLYSLKTLPEFMKMDLIRQIQLESQETLQRLRGKTERAMVAFTLPACCTELGFDVHTKPDALSVLSERRLNAIMTSKNVFAFTVNRGQETIMFEGTHSDLSRMLELGDTVTENGFIDGLVVTVAHRS